MSKATGDLLGHYQAKEIEGAPPPPGWNIAPTQDVPIIIEKPDEDSVALSSLPRAAAWNRDLSSPRFL